MISQIHNLIPYYDSPKEFTLCNCQNTETTVSIHKNYTFSQVLVFAGLTNPRQEIFYLVKYNACCQIISKTPIEPTRKGVVIKGKDYIVFGFNTNILPVDYDENCYYGIMIEMAIINLLFQEPFKITNDIPKYEFKYRISDQEASKLGCFSDGYYHTASIPYGLVNQGKPIVQTNEKQNTKGENRILSGTIQGGYTFYFRVDCFSYNSINALKLFNDFLICCYDPSTEKHEPLYKFKYIEQPEIELPTNCQRQEVAINFYGEACSVYHEKNDSTFINKTPE